MAHADGCPNAVSLPVGSTVKDCARVGLSADYDKTVRKELVEGDQNKVIVQQQTQIIQLKDLTIKSTQDEAAIWKQQSDAATEALEKEKNRSSMTLIGGILIGAGAILLSSWAVKNVSK
jgi:hypothetical protein